MKRLTLIGLLLSLTATGCMKRSSEFGKQQNYYDDAPKSYYDEDGKPQTPTEKFSKLGQPKKRIVVFNFLNSTPVDIPRVGEFAASEMRRGLYLSERVIFPEGRVTHFETVHFLDGDQVKVEQLIREGRRLGVSILLIGRIARVVFRQKGDKVGLFRQKQTLAAADVEMKLFDVASGRELMAIGRSGEATSTAMEALENDELSDPQYRAEMARLAIRDAVAQLVPNIARAVDKMEWRGLIAKIQGSKVYINAGTETGLVVGDILRVTTKGDDIFDPATGAFLGRRGGEIKGPLEIVDFVGRDASVARTHTGGQFTAGDPVRLY